MGETNVDGQQPPIKKGKPEPTVLEQEFDKEFSELLILCKNIHKFITIFLKCLYLVCLFSYEFKAFIKIHFSNKQAQNNS